VRCPGLPAAGALWPRARVDRPPPGQTRHCDRPRRTLFPTPWRATAGGTGAGHGHTPSRHTRATAGTPGAPPGRPTLPAGKPYRGATDAPGRGAAPPRDLFPGLSAAPTGRSTHSLLRTRKNIPATSAAAASQGDPARRTNAAQRVVSTLFISSSRAQRTRVRKTESTPLPTAPSPARRRTPGLTPPRRDKRPQKGLGASSACL
jgi:hypothetical protein